MYPGFVVADLESEDQTKTSMKLHKATQYIKSKLWWGFLVVLQSLNSVLSKSNAWVDGCSCHWDLLESRGGNDPNADGDAVEWPRVLLSAWRNCPLRGMRIAGVAAGDLHEHMSHAFNEGSVKFMLKLQREPELTKPEITMLLAQFECGRTHVVFSMGMKFAHWRTVPWGQAAMASRKTKKRLDGYYMLTAYLASGRTLHKQVAKWQEPTLRNELETWAIEEDFEFNIQEAGSFPTLKVELVLLRCTMYSDRFFEQPHAKTRRAIVRAHQHGVAYVNNQHKWPEVQVYVLASAKNFQHFSELIDRVPSASSALKLFGLDNHPGNKRDVSIGLKPHIERLIFGSDSWSMYVFQSPKVKTLAKVPHGFSAPASQPSTEAQTRQHLGAAWLVDLLKQDKALMEEGKHTYMYSAPVCHEAVQTVEGWLRGHVRQRLKLGNESQELMMDCRDDSLVFGVSGQIPAEDATNYTSLLVFKLVSTTVHLAQVASAQDARKIKADDIAVAPHAIVSASLGDSDTAEVIVEFHATTFKSIHGISSTVAFSASTLSFDCLQTIQRWQIVNAAHVLFCPDHQAAPELHQGTNLAHVAQVATNVANSQPLLNALVELLDEEQ